MNEEQPLKAAVTVAQMARMVGLSRARFYQLQKAGVFPAPKMDETKKRPFYDQELQQVCLDVRRRNQGVNGRVVLFYTRRQEFTPIKAQPRKVKAGSKEEPSALVEAVKALGLTTVTSAEVAIAVRELFPGGTGTDEAAVIRSIFLHLKRRQVSGDNVGR